MDQWDARTALVEVVQVGHAYGPVRALDDVSFRIAKGEFVALLGMNGAGKSTLFQLLSGLFTPSAGVIEVLGHDMRRDPVPALAMIGIVFQQPTLDPELTVSGNLLFHAGLHGLSSGEARGRISRELARIGLGGHENRKVATLSGGNRRRVELARALLHEPRLLLMDEPTVGLDPATRADLRRHVLGLRKEGVATLWATHLCEEAEEADRIIVLHEGRVLADTTPRTLLAQSGATSIEAAFLGMVDVGTLSPERVAARRPGVV